MKRVLVLLGRYYPNASPNSVCMKNILDCLPEEKYKVDIVSYDDGSASTNQNDIRINRGILQSLIYKYESLSADKKILGFLNYMLKIKNICCFLSWPWTDPIVTYRIMHRVKRLFGVNKYDIIIAVYMPLSSLIVADYIKKKNPSVKFIAYFLDSLSGGYLPNVLKKIGYEKKLIKWERRLIRNADKIVFMKASEDFHKQLYKGTDLSNRIIFLDLPMLKSGKQRHYSNKEKKLLLYVGSLAKSIRSPEYILKVFSLINDSALEFAFVGDSGSVVLNEYALKDSRIRVISRCSHDEANEYESNADVLINIGNKNSLLAPSKVFEYMSFGGKIVSTYSIEDDTSIRYLKMYDQSLLLDERDSDLIASAKKLRDFIYKEEERVSFEKLSSIFWENTPYAFVSMLDEIVQE